MSFYCKNVVCLVEQPIVNYIKSLSFELRVPKMTHMNILWHIIDMLFREKSCLLIAKTDLCSIVYLAKNALWKNTYENVY